MDEFRLTVRLKERRLLFNLFTSTLRILITNKRLRTKRTHTGMAKMRFHTLSVTQHLGKHEFPVQTSYISLPCKCLVQIFNPFFTPKINNLQARKFTNTSDRCMSNFHFGIIILLNRIIMQINACPLLKNLDCVFFFLSVYLPILHYQTSRDNLVQTKSK